MKFTILISMIAFASAGKTKFPAVYSFAMTGLEGVQYTQIAVTNKCYSLNNAKSVEVEYMDYGYISFCTDAECMRCIKHSAPNSVYVINNVDRYGIKYYRFNRI
ncbi:hypothetical protein BB559_004683 [Furculomyces boomerangus]|uniref:Uncharacterized protein n=2 Tax=Harpellales TaxID=61421 RepID=A0A2T9YDF3_9FUNG|nr:hypothetical protein BB559_004683 [Furculomyces boomerangus]PVZ97171.1 hypothetical protein BB558_006884 [Smittium angustum]PVZ97708.1 hypothetical protein BB558_006330 [Smittium angustum]